MKRANIWFLSVTTACVLLGSAAYSETAPNWKVSNEGKTSGVPLKPGAQPAKGQAIKQNEKEQKFIFEQRKERALRNLNRRVELLQGWIKCVSATNSYEDMKNCATKYKEANDAFNKELKEEQRSEQTREQHMREQMKEQQERIK